MGLAKKNSFSNNWTRKLIHWPFDYDPNQNPSLNCQLKLILSLSCNLSTLCQEVIWPALKTNPNTWPNFEIWHIDSLFHTLTPCRISSHDEFSVKIYWLSKLPSQNSLQENMSENSKSCSDLTLKIGQTDTWENKYWGICSLSKGQYEFIIWAHEK